MLKLKFEVMHLATISTRNLRLIVGVALAVIIILGVVWLSKRAPVDRRLQDLEKRLSDDEEWMRGCQQNNVPLENCNLTTGVLVTKDIEQVKKEIANLH